MNLVAAVLLAAHLVPAPSGPVQWCDPASPLFDPVICYNEHPGHGTACDPFGPAYDPDYCAASGRAR
jgi:hypothetical protein